jgi:hypothetical protein
LVTTLKELHDVEEFLLDNYRWRDTIEELSEKNSCQRFAGLAPLQKTIEKLAARSCTPLKKIGR